MKKQYATDLPWLEYDLKTRNAEWKQFRRCQAYTFYDGENLWILFSDNLKQITIISREYKNDNLDR